MTNVFKQIEKEVERTYERIEKEHERAWNDGHGNNVVRYVFGHPNTAVSVLSYVFGENAFRSCALALGDGPDGTSCIPDSMDFSSPWDGLPGNSAPLGGPYMEQRPPSIWSVPGMRESVKYAAIGGLALMAIYAFKPQRRG